MPTVKVQDGDIEDALAVFKRKCGEEAVIGEYKRRQAYIPPHEEKARKRFKAECRRKRREARKK